MKTMISLYNPFDFVFPVNRYNFNDSGVLSCLSISSDSFVRNADEYKLNISLPGFHKKDISMRIDEGKLIIEGKKSDKSSNRMFSSSFSRFFTVSHDMDVDKIKARFKNDILTVTIPRIKEFVTLRHIPVAGADKITDARVVDKTENKKGLSGLWRKLNNVFKKAS